MGILGISNTCYSVILIGQLRLLSLSLSHCDSNKDKADGQRDIDMIIA